MWMSWHISHHQPNPIPINNDNTALLPFAVHSWRTTGPSAHPGDDRRLPAPPSRLKGTVWCCAHGILGLPHSTCNTTQCTLVSPPHKCSWHPLWVSLAVHTTPPNVPLLAHLLCAHTTYMVPLQVCTAHTTPSSIHSQGCTTFPSAPVIFPHLPHLHMTS